LKKKRLNHETNTITKGNVSGFDGGYTIKRGIEPIRKAIAKDTKQFQDNNVNPSYVYIQKISEHVTVEGRPAEHVKKHIHAKVVQIGSEGMKLEDLHPNETPSLIDE